MDARIEALYTSWEHRGRRQYRKQTRISAEGNFLSWTSKNMLEKLPTGSEKKKHPGIKEQHFQRPDHKEYDVFIDQKGSKCEWGVRREDWEAEVGEEKEAVLNNLEIVEDLTDGVRFWQQLVPLLAGWGLMWIDHISSLMANDLKLG